MKPRYPDKKAFKAICTRNLESEPLTLSDVGNVFGQRFWEMLVYSLLDAGEAARAVQGAINRLKEGERVDDTQTS